MAKECKKCGCGICKKFLLLVFAVIFFVVAKTRLAGNSLKTIFPNFLLFTPYRQLTIDLWNNLIEINQDVIIDHPHIPIIEAEKYSFETLRVATENFRYPAVVRGLFKDTIGYKKWASPDYLPSKLGKHKLPVIRNAVLGKVQSDRVIMSFEEAFRDIVSNEQSKLYLFFPVKSRFFTLGADDALALENLSKDTNDVIYNDLDLNRIFPGFAGPNHKSYFGGQIIIGQGTDDDDSTGTGWHCAAGNNYFIQVVGEKRWYFLDPKYSVYMYPLRGGLVNMMTGNKNMVKLQKYLPIKYGDIKAGDMLYNPDWEWHTITNRKGLSIGVPLREVNISLSFQNNFQFTAIILINKTLQKFGIDIGGYPVTTN